MHTHPKRNEEGDGGGGAAPAATTKPEPTQAPAPAAAPAAQQQPTTTSTGTPEGFVPIDQFRAVTAERDTLNREKTAAEEKRQKDQGEWQTLAEKHEGAAKSWQERFIATARRAAFVAAAAGAEKDRVTDPDAAYKLALSDGLLKDVKVDDDGNADSDAIGKALKATIDKYAFLKAGSSSFGGERGGNQPTADPASGDMSPRERMRRAYESGR